MKKLFTLMFAVALTSGLYAQKTTETTVKTKAELQTALEGAAALSPGDIAYIYIIGSINLGSHTFASTTRNIHFVGINDEETGDRAQLLTEFVFPTNESEADKFALTFENLHIMDNNGEWSNSKHFINFKDANKHYVDSFVVKNCEISNICRSFLRGQIDGAPTDGTYTGCGTFNYFEMSNTTFHNGSRQDNAMPLIYMAWSTNEMVFRNNTFYDLPYLNALVTFNYMTDETGRQPVKFYFENNTICAYAKSTLFNFGTYVTSDSEFHIKNNILMFPNWSDDSNNRIGDTRDNHDMSEEAVVRDGGVTTFGYLTDEEIAARIEKGTTLTNILGGLVQMENNLLLGYKYQNFAHTKVGEEYVNYIETGDIIPIGDTEEEFFDDFAPALTMEDVPFAWTDFADPQNDFFQINLNNPAHSAGKNGAPLGDENNYTDKVIKVVTLNVTVAGSKSAKVTVTPEKSAYTTGDEVTLTADCNGSLNTFKGWSNGMTEETITLTLEDNVDLTANFEEIDYLAVWNLDDIASNNVVKTPPVKTNYGNSLTLDYARYINEDEAYRFGADNSAEDYDGAKKAIQTRNNKVSGDVRNCFIIQTPSTQFYAEAEGKADYLIINVNEALAASKLQFFVASDNVPYNKYIVSYTTDGTTWTEAGTFDMEGKTQTNEWYLVEINLPELAQGSKIRIKGDETSGVTLTGDMQAMRDADPDMSLEDIGVTTEFLFIAEIIIAPASGEQPKAKGDVNGDNAVDVADISSIITVMAAGGNDPAADVNNDGAVDVADISSVISIMAGGE